MSQSQSVVFLQKRVHRAGAQTCLARLLRHAEMRQWQPVLVCEGEGWLSAEARRAGVTVITTLFPGSRSLAARLWGNAQFARRVRQQIAAAGIRPGLVHANDHWEGLLGLALARDLGVRSAIFLRSPGMTREDYFKYRCREYDLIIAVGDELQQRVRGWDAERNIRLIHDGIEASEHCPLKPKPPVCPARILVIGSPLNWKGWADLTEALFILQTEGGLPDWQFDFTGDRPDPKLNDLKLERLQKGQYKFLGRVEKFRDLVREYDLVINPTRQESFGMAAIEVLFAGVPLLSTRTGIIEQAQENPLFLVPPRQAQVLAAALKHLMSNWAGVETGVAAAQENIRRKFLVDHGVSKLCAAYREIL